MRELRAYLETIHAQAFQVYSTKPITQQTYVICDPHTGSVL
jgi:hypothetical protein